MGRDFPPMKALALSLPLLLAGCGSGHEASQSAEPPAVDLPVTTASPAASMDGATASGTVEADDRAQLRSEARRVGNEGVSKCKSRWSPVHVKKNQTKTTTDK